MRAVDKYGRLFGIINIVDLCIIVMLLLVTGSGIYKVLVVNPTLAVSTKKVTIKLVLPQVSREIAEAAVRGDIIKDYDKGFTYGKVVEKEVETAAEQTEEASREIKYEVTLYVETDAVISATTVRIDNQEVKIGWTSAIKARTFTADGRITDIKIH